MNTKLNPLALGGASAAIAAFVMLGLGILGNLGVYTGAVEAMQQWHIFFSLGIGGIIAGMIEGAVSAFLGAYLFGWLYNQIPSRVT